MTISFESHAKISMQSPHQSSKKCPPNFGFFELSHCVHHMNVPSKSDKFPVNMTKRADSLCLAVNLHGLPLTFCRSHWSSCMVFTILSESDAQGRGITNLDILQARMLKRYWVKHLPEFHGIRAVFQQLWKSDYQNEWVKKNDLPFVFGCPDFLLRCFDKRPAGLSVLFANGSETQAKLTTRARRKQCFENAFCALVMRVDFDYSQWIKSLII